MCRAVAWSCALAFAVTAFASDGKLQRVRDEVRDEEREKKDEKPRKEDRHCRAEPAAVVGVGVAAETPDCKLKDTNQYLLDVTEPGKYVACGGTNSPGTCGHCILDDDDFGVIHASPAGLCRIEGSLTF